MDGWERTRGRLWCTEWLILAVVCGVAGRWGALVSVSAADRTAEIERLTADLGSPSSTVRVRAAVGLVKLAPEVREAIPALAAALGDGFQPVRWNAAKALGLIGPEARAAVPALAKSLKTPDWSGSAQVMAAWALGRIGPAARDAVPTLAHVLTHDKQPIVRRAAAHTLAAIGSEAKPALPELKAALADENGFVRVAAATALWQVGQDAGGVPLLVEALKDPTIVGARIAADALAEIGPGARQAVPALVAALDDPASCARVATARALWLVGRDARGVPALVAALKDPMPEVRDAAAENLRLVARKSKVQVPGLADAIKAYERQRGALPSHPTTLVLEVEDWTGPKDAILKNKYSPNKWRFDTNFKGMSKNTVLFSPSVMKDRATPQEGAPVLHTHVTGICNGTYVVTARGYRPLAISLDGGKTWKKLDGSPMVGRFDITNGVFDLWVDDRYATADGKHLGPSYYDTLTFMPAEPTTVATVQGWAKERVRERLSRGLSAVRLAEGGVYVNWRLLEGDPAGIAFDLYRQEDGGPRLRLNGEPITRTTDFLDRAAPGDKQCRYSAVLAGKTKDRVPSPAVAAAAAEPPYVSIKFQGDYQAYQLGIADLDGDGRYDYVIKQPAYGIWNGEYLWHRSTKTYKLEAYNADGRLLWRYDMGWGIELGPWHSPFVVHDFDGDGRAEVACKAADADPRDAEGRVQTGPEYVAILDGLTGKTRCRAPWPSRAGFTAHLNWLNQLCVAYLDGKTPCLIIERGTYGLQKVDAYQLRSGRLERVWSWNNLGADKIYYGQGAHTLHAADVDGDGRDEVIVGSSVLDDNGAPLWSTGYGHVDHCFVGDIDPLRPGLEVFYTVERPRATDGACLVDARTGKVIWGLSTQTYHVGRALAADIDPTHPGCECMAGEDPKGDPKGRGYERKPPRWLFSAQGKIISERGQPGAVTWGGASHAAYWDADVQRELLRGGRVHDYQGSVHPPGLDGRVLGVADVMGDWREEIFTTVPGELRIYSTTIPAKDRRVCLMQDPIYRLCVTSNSQAYYSLPQTSVCLSSAIPSLTIRGPAAGLLPEKENPCTVTLVASTLRPVAGAIQLSADAGTRLTPATFAARVAKGGVERFPFTVRPAAPSPFGARPFTRISVVVKPDGGHPEATTIAFPIVEPPLSAMPLVEAEDFVEESGGAIRIRSDKVGVSGKAFSHWNDKGHRLAWQSQVPRAGRYRLVMRHSCTQNAERSLLVDGKALPGAERVRFPATGGYGSSAGEWSNLAVRLPDGQLAAWQLSAGPHKITMESTDGSGLNMDQLAWVPEP